MFEMKIRNIYYLIIDNTKDHIEKRLLYIVLMVINVGKIIFFGVFALLGIYFLTLFSSLFFFQSFWQFSACSCEIMFNRY